MFSESHQGHDLDPFPVAQGHELGTGVRHGGKAGLGNEAHVAPAVEQAAEGRDLRRGRVLVELVEFQSLDMAFETCTGQETPGCPDLLDHEAVQRGQDGQDRGRKHVGRVVVPERGWNQV